MQNYLRITTLILALLTSCIGCAPQWMAECTPTSYRVVSYYDPTESKQNKMLLIQFFESATEHCQERLMSNYEITSTGGIHYQEFNWPLNRVVKNQRTWIRPPFEHEQSPLMRWPVRLADGSIAQTFQELDRYEERR